jgi:hypothetical protein
MKCGYQLGRRYDFRLPEHAANVQASGSYFQHGRQIQTSIKILSQYYFSPRRVAEKQRREKNERKGFWPKKLPYFWLHHAGETQECHLLDITGYEKSTRVDPKWCVFCRNSASEHLELWTTLVIDTRLSQVQASKRTKKMANPVLESRSNHAVTTLVGLISLLRDDYRRHSAKVEPDRGRF